MSLPNSGTQWVFSWATFRQLATNRALTPRTRVFVHPTDHTVAAYMLKPVDGTPSITIHVATEWVVTPESVFVVEPVQRNAYDSVTISNNDGIPLVYRTIDEFLSLYDDVGDEEALAERSSQNVADAASVLEDFNQRYIDSGRLHDDHDEGSGEDVDLNSAT